MDDPAGFLDCNAAIAGERKVPRYPEDERLTALKEIVSLLRGVDEKLARIMARLGVITGAGT